jgi:hypothetical protein
MLDEDGQKDSSSTVEGRTPMMEGVLDRILVHILVKLALLHTNIAFK